MIPPARTKSVFVTSESIVNVFSLAEPVPLAVTAGIPSVKTKSFSVESTFVQILEELF